jgi:hypothetical protein
VSGTSADSGTDAGVFCAVPFKWRIRGSTPSILETQVQGAEWVEQARGSRRGCADVLSAITQGKRKLLSSDPGLGEKR